MPYNYSYVMVHSLKLCLRRISNTDEAPPPNRVIHNVGNMESVAVPVDVV